MTGVNGVSYGPHGRTLIGEVIEASTTEILAQALELGGAPAFGTFVEVTCDDGITLYGVVAHVETGGIDPGARAIMRGHDDVRDDRIYVENPDLPLVLRTLFRAVIVGFASDGKLYQFLPPRPPRLHYSVFTCTSGSVERFVASGLDYLGTLLMAPEIPADELIAANLRLTSAACHDTEAFLHAAGKELAQLLRADYARLTGILRRCV